MHACMYVFIYVCVYLCVCIYVSITYIHIHTHTHTHTHIADVIRYVDEQLGVREISVIGRNSEKLLPYFIYYIDRYKWDFSDFLPAIPVIGTHSQKKKYSLRSLHAECARALDF